MLESTMRLDHEESTALAHALAGVPGQAFLFGSRVNDAARGGDIDVLVLSSGNPYRLSQRIATAFFAMCEEKLDVVVMNPERLTPEQRAFLSVIHTAPLP